MDRGLSDNKEGTDIVNAVFLTNESPERTRSEQVVICKQNPDD